MAYVLATNITSPLGMTTAANYQAVKAKRSALRRYEGLWGLPEPCTASLFTDEQRHAMAIDGLTRFESLVVYSVQEALAQLNIDIAAKNVCFILSTTKANVELLDSIGCEPGPTIYPGETAQRIAHHLGFTTSPIVVCNACISGVAAIILAQRLLDGGCYDYAVVCGADVQNRFTVSGFQSLKAVSADDCRPFDMERNGLNLGEAAATMVLCGRQKQGGIPMASEDEGRDRTQCLPIIEYGVIRNDAFHISSPSKNGEGAWLALRDLDVDVNHTAFINAHGTATMFNDQMESVAIERAGLNPIPVNGLKGYYGHTLGAAGVLETVISLTALRDHTILSTRGFEERGVSGKICITAENADTDKTTFVKMISGFGGCNAAITVSASALPNSPVIPRSPIIPTHRVTLTPTTATVGGQPLSSSNLTALYKTFVGDYPKYYKMDGLSRLGFIATELLLQAEGEERFQKCDDRAVVLMGSSSSIDVDKKYMETIAADNFFPSPSLFIYTLPNIVTGEIAMRNLYHGETSFYLLPERNEKTEKELILATLQDKKVKSVITGWIDYYDENNYMADLSIVAKQ